MADDDPDVSQLLQMLLENAGHTVTRCEEPEAALDALSHGEHRSLITDLRLPGRGGIALIRETRKRTPDCQIITLTGSTLPADRNDSAQAGADYFFSKPVQIQTLLDALLGCTDDGKL